MFSVQIGHGRADIAAAAGEQMRTLAYMPSWSSTTPPTIEASNLIASLAPGDLDVVFLVSSGSEAVESAIKFSRQYHSARNEPRRVKVISRNLSYHGTTLGALSATGLTGIPGGLRAAPLRVPQGPQHAGVRRWRGGGGPSGGGHH